MAGRKDQNDPCGQLGSCGSADAEESRSQSVNKIKLARAYKCIQGHSR